MKYHHSDIVQAAIKRYRTKQLALEEVNGTFRIRTVRTSIEFGYDAVRNVRTAYETNVRTLAGPFGSLTEMAKFLGVENR